MPQIHPEEVELGFDLWDVGSKAGSFSHCTHGHSRPWEIWTGPFHVTVTTLFSKILFTFVDLAASGLSGSMQAL